MRHRRASIAALLCLLACGGSGRLAPPTSDKQSDDPCDPGGGGSTVGPAPPVDAGAAPVAMPGTPPGVGFDELRFSGTLSRLLVPAGRTGNLDLVDPSSEAIIAVGGFSTSDTYSGDDTFGVTSADEGNALVYAVDRTTSTLAVVDPKKLTIVAKVSLAATPGYVRYVAPTNEVWVTEPSRNQIEVFTVADPSTPPAAAATIAVPGGGPESLEIDAAGGHAYTNGTTSTIAIDLTARAVSDQWSNGCTTSRGIAIDPTNGWLMPVCQEGLVVVLAAQGGATIGTASVGGGVDQVSYDSQAKRLYVPAAAAAAMSVVSLGSNGMPKVLGSIQTTNDAH
ncbi:MAG: YncE family protein, partial [Polyangiaceae bacterium]